MDVEYQFIIAGIFALWIVWEIVKFPTSDENKTLHLMSVGTTTVGFMLILAFSYTEDWILLLLLGIVCLPFCLYNWYWAFKEDKKRLVTDVSLITLFIAVTWMAHFGLL